MDNFTIAFLAAVIVLGIYLIGVGMGGNHAEGVQFDEGE